MIFKIKKLDEKTKPTTNYVIEFPNTIVFTSKYKAINKLIKGKKYISEMNLTPSLVFEVEYDESGNNADDFTSARCDEVPSPPTRG